MYIIYRYFGVNKTKCTYLPPSLTRVTRVTLVRFHTVNLAQDIWAKYTGAAVNTHSDANFTWNVLMNHLASRSESMVHYQSIYLKKISFQVCSHVISIWKYQQHNENTNRIYLKMAKCRLTRLACSVYCYLRHDGTVPTCFNQSKASISFD